MSRVNGTSKIQCICGDSTEVISALSFSFSPNTIDFSTVFSQFDINSQGAVLGTLLAIYLLFTLLGVWAHYMDRASMMNWGVFPLMDNYADDDYYYLLTVHTGLRKAAGTTSKVGFCIAGSLEETGVRVLSDGVREGFPTGSVAHLVMAAPGYLGELETLRIWHDSSGKGDNASWYLDRVDVMDLQKGHLYHFLCEEWLTPEEAVDRIVQPSDPADLESLRSAFFTNTKQKVTEDHIWLSVFLRPERSRFSRVERVGCCVCFLALAMITSAMFYQGGEGADRKQPAADLEMGPIKLSLQQVYYSVVSAVIASIPLVLIIYLFRKSRIRTEPGRYWCCGKHHSRGAEERKNSAQIWDDWEEELREYGIGEGEKSQGIFGRKR
ncbi:polycystic kidney disease protein 1-like 2 [Elysia marginata]|uniref:Polycystic kidney disease protein 1-like 2 n=1 Tax=Elysia marginata TaxID=1093978 RepID=A0AAV4FTA7_9GAST|nr:polycystic kidney disease protein 1-like 2 [Elysia marginata]